MTFPQECGSAFAIMGEPGAALTAPALVSPSREGANMPQGTCSVDGCARPERTRGWCALHYQRWLRRQPPLRPGLGRKCSIEGCTEKHMARGWCALHYHRWLSYGDPLRVRPSLADRLWSNVDRSGGPDACWPWLGNISRRGYGGIQVNRSTKGAHQVAWFLTYGAWPDQVLDHTCHNGSGCAGGDACLHRRCCNPAHLEDVSVHTNTLRGQTLAAAEAAKTHCLRGHPLSGPNLAVRSGKRACRTCERLRNAGYRAKRAAAWTQPENR